MKHVIRNAPPEPKEPEVEWWLESINGNPTVMAKRSDRTEPLIVCSFDPSSNGQLVLNLWAINQQTGAEYGIRTKRTALSNMESIALFSGKVTPELL